MYVYAPPVYLVLAEIKRHQIPRTWGYGDYKLVCGWAPGPEPGSSPEPLVLLTAEPSLPCLTALIHGHPSLGINIAAVAVNIPFD